MSVTFSSSIVAVIGTGTATPGAITLTSVPAGATIFVGIQNRSDQTTTLSGISDDVNGAWTPDLVSGPVDAAAGGTRVWFAYRNNCASGTTAISVTFSAAINSQIVAGYMVSDAGAMTFDAAATPYESAIGATAVDSNTVSAAGAGAIAGFLSTNNAQADPEPSADGAGESRITTGQAGGRAFLFVESYGSGGTYGFETTTDATVGLFLVGAFLEPSGASAPKRSLLLGIG